MGRDFFSRDKIKKPAGIEKYSALLIASIQDEDGLIGVSSDTVDTLAQLFGKNCSVCTDGSLLSIWFRGISSAGELAANALSVVNMLRRNTNGASISINAGGAAISGANADRYADRALACLRSAINDGTGCYCVEDSGGGISRGSDIEDVRSDAGHYQALLKYMSGGIFLAEVGDEIKITYASPGAFSASDENVNNALSMIYPADLDSVTGAARLTASTGEITDVTYRTGEKGDCWRHLRIVRLLSGGATPLVIGVLTDLTAYKVSEEKLRISEEKYRIATELSRIVLWETDIASRTLYMSNAGSDGCYENMPEGYIAAGRIHRSSADDFRRMYDDLYSGRENSEYMILSSDDNGGYVWMRYAFRIIKSEQGIPVRSVGIAERMPDAGKDMQSFEDELRFSRAMASDRLFILRADLSRDIIDEDTLDPSAVGMSYDCVVNTHIGNIHADHRDRFLATLSRSAMLGSFESQKRWLFLGYLVRDDDGKEHWRELAVNLLRHPVSRNIFAFAYFRNTDERHSWVAAATYDRERDPLTLLYTADTFTQIVKIAARKMQNEETCSLTVIDIMCCDRIRKQNGSAAVNSLLHTVGHLLRVMIGGDMIIGHISETRFAVFKTNISSSGDHRGFLIRAKNKAGLLLDRQIDVRNDIVCGYVISDKSSFDFDEMLRRAEVACAMAKESPENPVCEYMDPSDKFLMRTLTAAADSKRKNVLIADDDSFSRSIVAMNLVSEYNVDEAGDGADAFEMLHKKDYAILLCDIQMPRMSGWDVLEAMQREKLLIKTPVIMITADGGRDSEVAALNMGAADVIVKPIVPEVLRSRARNIIGRQEAAAAIERNAFYEMRFIQQSELLRKAEFDELTGLLNKQGFFRHVRERLDASPGELFLILRWDIDRFKMVNDTLGVEAGDRLLKDIGSAIHERDSEHGIYARLEADHFVFLLKKNDTSPAAILEEINGWLTSYTAGSPLTAHMGIYIADDPAVEVSVMCDRALLALRSVKASYTQRIAYYDESLRSAILEEQELSGEMVSALESGQFATYFQPQINYENGALIGAEALVRWVHPVKGIIPPAKFIPLFERNGFITALDEYIWEASCRYMQKWRTRKIRPMDISVSVNISRVDIYKPGLCQFLLSLVGKYDLTPSSLRLEITESAYMENPEQLISSVQELRSAGFTVEMDDFGSGFSSLNTLKDVPINVLKLDTRFLSGCDSSGRGGSILSSIIRMAQWLDIPVIAEGVETQGQAEYLKSLNCLYMQGYFFGKPMPATEFECMQTQYLVAPLIFGPDDKVSAFFWDQSERSTMLFNSLTEGSAIIEYRDGVVEIIRANDMYYHELGISREAYGRWQKRMLSRFDGSNGALFKEMLETAAKKGGEAECTVECLPFYEGGETFIINNHVYLLISNSSCKLFCLTIKKLAQRNDMDNHNGGTEKKS